MSLKAGIVTCIGEGCFLWTIHDLLSLGSQKIRSPVFYFAGGSHSMRLYCYKNIESGTDKVELLFTNFSNVLNRLHVKLGMGTGMWGKQETRSGETDGSGHFLVRKWMTCSEMLERSSEILRHGCLTINCELRLEAGQNVSKEQGLLPSKRKAAFDNDSDDEKTIPMSKAMRRMQEDFSSLLMNKEDSDVTIKVKGKEFPAHRIILRVRSPVFKSMFSHNMVERESGVVVIDDCDPDTFPDFLNYVYTGSTKHISDKNVYSLYSASDKYFMGELKEECKLFMKNNLSVDNFCDILALAAVHNDQEFIELASDFFCKNMAEIIKTSKWETFLHENTTVGNALFIKSLSTGENS